MRKLLTTSILLSVLAPVLVVAAPQVLIDFEVEDQFKKVHTRAEVDGKVFVIVGSDRAGSSFNSPWAQAIWDGVKELGIEERVVITGLADLRGAPFFVKKMIRGSFSDKPEEWAIMDWEGVFPEAYGFEEGVPNLLVFGPDGALLHRTSGRPVDDTQVTTILDKTAAALE